MIRLDTDITIDYTVDKAAIGLYMEDNGLDTLNYVCKIIRYMYRYTKVDGGAIRTMVSKQGETYQEFSDRLSSLWRREGNDNFFYPTGIVASIASDSKGWGHSQSMGQISFDIDKKIHNFGIEDLYPINLGDDLTLTVNKNELGELSFEIYID